MEWICVAQNDTPNNNYSQYFCDSVLLFQWKRAKYFSPCKDEIYITLSPSSCRLPHAVSSVAITTSHLTVLCTPTIVNETPSSATSSILYEFAARCARFKALWLIFIQLRCYLLFLFWHFFSLHTFIKATNTFIELDVHTCIPEHWHSFTVN